MEQNMLLEKNPADFSPVSSGLYYTDIRVPLNKIWCHSQILFGNSLLLSAFQPF